MRGGTVTQACPAALHAGRGRVWTCAGGHTPGVQWAPRDPDRQAQDADVHHQSLSTILSHPSSPKMLPQTFSYLLCFPSSFKSPRYSQVRPSQFRGWLNVWFLKANSQIERSVPLLSPVNAERSLPALHRRDRTRTHEQARAATQFLAHKEAHGCLEAAPAPAETTAPALRLPPAAEGWVPRQRAPPRVCCAWPRDDFSKTTARSEL